MPSSTTLTTLDDLRDVLARDPGQDHPDASRELAAHYGLPTAHGILDWTELPTFGGEVPSETQGVWSWDATRVLVGTGARDLRLASRSWNPEDAALLRRAIEVSGRSIREFAAVELVRDPRTVTRWLAGDRPIPQVVVDRCRAIAGE